MRSIACLFVLFAISAAGPAFAADEFAQCARDEVMRSIRESSVTPDKKKVVNDVEGICMLQDMDAATWTSKTHEQIAADTKHEESVVAKLYDQLKASAAAQGDEVRKTGRDYVACLKEHARVMALSTNEAADIVVQGAMSSCPDQRKAIADARAKYEDIWSEEAAEAMDGVIAKRLLTDVVAARATRNLTPRPAPPSPAKQAI